MADTPDREHWGRRVRVRCDATDLWRVLIGDAAVSHWGSRTAAEVAAERLRDALVPIAREAAAAARSRLLAEYAAGERAWTPLPDPDVTRILAEHHAAQIRTAVAAEREACAEAADYVAGQETNVASAAVGVLPDAQLARFRHGAAVAGMVAAAIRVRGSEGR